VSDAPLDSKFEELDKLAKSCAKFDRLWRAYRVDVAINAQGGRPRKPAERRRSELAATMNVIAARIKGLDL
jgi:hypothetical protein